jgi:hypothetical protein
MAWPASDAGRLLERVGDGAPRGMIVLDRTRLIGPLCTFFCGCWLCLVRLLFFCAVRGLTTKFCIGIMRAQFLAM